MGHENPRPLSTAGAEVLTNEPLLVDDKAANAGNCSRARVNPKAQESRGAGQGPFGPAGGVQRAA